MSTYLPAASVAFTVPDLPASSAATLPATVTAFSSTAALACGSLSGAASLLMISNSCWVAPLLVAVKVTSPAFTLAALGATFHSVSETSIEPPAAALLPLALLVLVLAGVLVAGVLVPPLLHAAASPSSEMPASMPTRAIENCIRPSSNTSMFHVKHRDRTCGAALCARGIVRAPTLRREGMFRDCCGL